MLNLKIYGASTTSKETVLQLSKPEIGGAVYLAVVNAITGEKVPRGNLIAITPEGTIQRCAYIDPNLGFQLDRSKQVMIEGGK